jgi:cell division protein FtsB
MFVYKFLAKYPTTYYFTSLKLVKLIKQMNFIKFSPLLLLVVGVLLASSCVPQKQFKMVKTQVSEKDEQLLAANQKIALLDQKATELEKENKRLTNEHDQRKLTSKQNLGTGNDSKENQIAQLNAKIKSLEAKIAALENGKKTTAPAGNKVDKKQKTSY